MMKYRGEPSKATHGCTSNGKLLCENGYQRVPPSFTKELCPICQGAPDPLPGQPAKPNFEPTPEPKPERRQPEAIPLFDYKHEHAL